MSSTDGGVDTLEIAAVGMVTSLGINAQRSVAAIKAGLSAYQSSDMLNPKLNPITMALVPNDVLPPIHPQLQSAGLTVRQKRLLKLSAVALSQLFDQHPIASPIPLLLACPEKIAARRAPIDDKFLPQLMCQTGSALDIANSCVFPQGRAAGFYALEHAITLLQGGQHQQVILGGADSFRDPYLLAMLAKDNRVKTLDTNNAFVPGEGATFLLLQKAKAESQQIKISPPALACEPGHRYSDEPYKGEGLAQAVTEALQHNKTGALINTVLSSFNGEHFSAKEWGVSSVRNQHCFSDTATLLHPVDCMGDIGAAMVPTLMAIANVGIHNGFVQVPCLAWCSSETEHRGAVCLT